METLSKDLLRQVIGSNEIALQKEQQKARQYRFSIQMSKDEFTTLLNLKAQQIFFERKELQSKPFNIDTYNQKALDFLHQYLTGQIDNSKGIWLYSPIKGNGKTVLLTSFSRLITELWLLQQNRIAPSIKTFTEIPAKLLHKLMKETNDHVLYKCPLLIDDFGREVKEAYVEYSKLKPMVFLMSNRYDSGAWTFVTSQVPIDYFISEQRYGEALISRLKAMFHMIELTGQSRRI